MQRSLFESSILSKGAKEYWEAKPQQEICELLGRDVAAMYGFDQHNPHHCYDLWTHSLWTLDNLKNRYPTSGMDDVYLLIAALLHDVGKPAVAKQKGDRLVFYGHSAKSVQIAETTLSGLGYSRDEIGKICFYIAHHDDFISYVLPEEDYDHNNPFLIPITDKNVFSHICSVEATIEATWYTRSLWNRLLLLCIADAEAQAPLVYQDGILVDSIPHKLSKLEAVRDILNNHRQSL